MITRKVPLPLFYYDTINILSESPQDELRYNIEPVISGRCGWWRIFNAHPLYKQYGYSSCLKIMSLDSDCLDSVAFNSEILGKHTITRVDIAEDTFLSSNMQSLTYLDKVIAKHGTRFRMKHESTIFLFNEKHWDRDKDKGILSTVTEFHSQKKVKYNAYARNSKITGKPCLHTEYSLIGSAKIKRRLFKLFNISPEEVLHGLAGRSPEEIYKGVEADLRMSCDYSPLKLRRLIGKALGIPYQSSEAGRILGKIKDAKGVLDISVGLSARALKDWAVMCVGKAIGKGYSSRDPLVIVAKHLLLTRKKYPCATR